MKDEEEELEEKEEGRRRRRRREEEGGWTREDEGGKEGTRANCCRAARCASLLLAVVPPPLLCPSISSVPHGVGEAAHGSLAWELREPRGAQGEGHHAVHLHPRVAVGCVDLLRVELLLRQFFLLRQVEPNGPVPFEVERQARVGGGAVLGLEGARPARDAPGPSRERDLSLLPSRMRIRGLDRFLPLSRDCDAEPPSVLPRYLDLLTLTVLSSDPLPGVFTDL